MHTRDTRHLAGVVLLVALLSGCAHAPQTRKLERSPPTGLPAQVELTETPFFPQRIHQCGPAALATVLNANHVRISPQQLVDEVYVPGMKGSLLEELVASARHHGQLAYPLAPVLTDLLAEIAAGHPVLVYQNLGFRWLPSWHFAVLIGYQLDREELILRSGTTQRWRTSFSTFERTWRRGGYQALAIVPAGTIPASAQPLRYLQATQDLDESGNLVAAGAAWLAASRRWPRQPLVWMGLGNHAFAEQAYDQATGAFLQAVQHAPEDPDGWNNLAYALQYRGCPTQARKAIRCALQLAPQDSNVLDSASEISAMQQGNDQPDCPSIHCDAP